MSKSEIVVKKFGGTSVGSLERIDMVAERIFEDSKKGQKPIIVASAMSGETNRLVELANRMAPDYRGPAYDMLVASGEQVSISLLTMALAKRGLAAQPLLAYQLGIKTDSIYSKAKILDVNGKKLTDLAEKNIIPVVAGFQGIDEETNVTTLGRGGSDTTAVALAASIQSDVCEIYTDVPAVFSADPRLVKKAREIPALSYEEMMEMASLGSKVLHIRSVEMAVKYGVKVHLRSTFEKREGTWIVPEGEVVEKPLVSSVTHDASTLVVKLFPVPKGPEFLSQLFDQLSAKGVVVDIITQSQNEEGQRLAFSINKEDLANTRSVLKELLPPGIEAIEMDHMAKISVVGVGMRTHSGVAAKFFKVFAENKIPIHLVTTSEIKISAVIDNDNLKTAAEILHQKFDLDTQA